MTAGMCAETGSARRRNGEGIKEREADGRCPGRDPARGAGRYPEQHDGLDARRGSRGSASQPLLSRHGAPARLAGREAGHCAKSSSAPGNDNFLARRENRERAGATIGCWTAILAGYYLGDGRSRRSCRRPCPAHPNREGSTSPRGRTTFSCDGALPSTFN